MIRTSLITLIVSTALLALPSYSYAQAASDQDLRAGLLDLKMSGPIGSLKVAKMFAECHGFQMALYNKLTSDIILRLEESDFASNIGEQAMVDGHMAFLSSVSHIPEPKGFVNEISKTERQHWTAHIQKAGKIDELTWERLSLCQKLAPMSQYFVEDMRKKEKR